MKSVIVGLVAGSDQAHSKGETNDLCLMDVALLLDVLPQVLGPENEPAEEFLHTLGSFKFIIKGIVSSAFYSVLLYKNKSYRCITLK